MTRTHEYMQRAADVAKQSPDTSTENGAVIVSSWNNVISTACNTFPRGVSERLDRPEKYTFIEHAERNAIFEAARYTGGCHGATMYCIWAACADCARAIVQSGIRHLVTMKSYRDNGPDRWDLTDADTILREGGVRLTLYTPTPPLDRWLRFNEEWTAL